MEKTTCAIAGGGPAGLMLGLLLARAGVLAGVPVSRLIPNDPAVANLIVLAATELTTDEDIDMLGECLHAALEDQP